MFVQTLLGRCNNMYALTAAGKLTGMLCCVGPLPQGVEALLIHSDNVEPPPVQLSMTAECPKVGLSLALAEDWSSRTGSSPDAGFYHLEAAVKGISADLRPIGVLTYASKQSWIDLRETAQTV